MHGNDCPKCGSAIDSGTKSCGSCGSARRVFELGLVNWDGQPASGLGRCYETLLTGE